MWSAAEVNISIICACIPTLKPITFRLSLFRDDAEASTPPEWADGHLKPNASSRNDFMPQSLRTPPPAAGQSKNINQPPPAVDLIAKVSEGGNSMHFITTPEELNMESSCQTVDSAAASSPEMTFVRFENPHSLAKMKKKESLFPLVLATILLFISGFAYGFLNTLNCKFEQAVDMSPGKIIGLSGAFFAYVLYCSEVRVFVLTVKQKLPCGATYLWPTNFEEMGFQSRLYYRSLHI